MRKPDYDTFKDIQIELSAAGFSVNKNDEIDVSLLRLIKDVAVRLRLLEKEIKNGHK